MGSELCITAEPHPNVSMMLFREKMEDHSCGSWIPPLNDPTTSRGLVEIRPHLNQYGAVGRMIIGQNIYLGHVTTPRRAKPAYFPIDGNEVRENTNYELLSVGLNCSLAWVSYTTGDTVPAAALQLGYVAGVGPTYSVRVHRPDLNTDKFGVYAAGDSVTYYPYFGVQSVTEVDILVQV